MTITSDAPVLTTSGLVESLARNIHVITMQAAGLSHADSLLQPQPRGNCFNWVVGHVLVFRQSMLAALGQEPTWEAESLAHYGYGSAPIIGDGEGVLPFADLLSALDETQEKIVGVLSTISESDLAAPTPRNNPRTVAADLHYLMWHEVYHVGQTELLRQLTGVNDKLV